MRLCLHIHRSAGPEHFLQMKNLIVFPLPRCISTYLILNLTFKMTSLILNLTLSHNFSLMVITIELILCPPFILYVRCIYCVIGTYDEKSIELCLLEERTAFLQCGQALQEQSVDSEVFTTCYSSLPNLNSLLIMKLLIINTY